MTLTSKNKAESDHSNKKLMKASLRQKSFLGVIQSDTNSEILTLDTNTWEIDYLWMIISNLTSTQYTNLPLIMLVDKHYWSSQGYYFQFMPHMDEE